MSMYKRKTEECTFWAHSNSLVTNFSFLKARIVDRPETDIANWPITGLLAESNPNLNKTKTSKYIYLIAKKMLMMMDRVCYIFLLKQKFNLNI